jgi:hypothetical protein
MAIETRANVNQIEVLADGHIQVRFALELADSGKVIDRTWHRTTVEPGGDVDAQIAAVNAHLNAGVRVRPDVIRVFPVLPAGEIRPIKDHAAVAWKRELVEAHREKVAAGLTDPADRQKYRAAFLRPEDLAKFPAL